MANTHLLIDNNFIYGIKSNIRIRENNCDEYVPINQLFNDNVYDGWLPIGGVFWINYRTDSTTLIKKIPPQYAFPNLQWFTESVGNWEMKEDMADYCKLDPFEFADQMNKISGMLNDFCLNNTSIYYLNLNIFSNDGLLKTISLMDTMVN